ncbi:MAG: L-seryl-tRNA(Sec) selenium transferase [SAR202 cluster bacterium]|nr:L-seryl-tRNA(Sec) selenium transferase [SAR202 cluster bacterium]|tara:strand:+ start:86172 stop:87569 length:1398 start_codon:yes stop_codon:yes gene_type:complete
MNQKSKNVISLSNEFRKIPSVESLLSNQNLIQSTNNLSREYITKVIQKEISKLKSKSINNNQPLELNTSEIIKIVKQQLELETNYGPQNVINATGVILHTNLGRSTLSKDSINSMLNVANNYSSIEYNLNSGERGSRQEHLSSLLCNITGAESALTVNNNAAALILTLSTLAKGKEIIISRSESVEIGGGFRIPDILSSTGASLIEIGTTNKTYLEDYEKAINKNTAAIIMVHASNFEITGFTYKPSMNDISKLAKSYEIPLIHDLGSGCLINTESFGLTHEQTPQESIKNGSSLVLFSADKLLGGPQAGIIIGQSKLLEKISKNPMARAVRIDKFTMASLQSTLKHYVENEITKKIPIWIMISQKKSSIFNRVKKWQDICEIKTEITETQSTIGGGSLPGQLIPSFSLSIPSSKKLTAIEIAKKLRRNSIPIISRIENEKVLLDARTVFRKQDKYVSSALKNLF